MRRVLIVANETAGGTHLRDARGRKAPPTRSRPSGWTAHSRGFATWGPSSSTGLVGVERPMDAVMDMLRTQRFDEIIVSTLPHGVSHWLRIDLPARVARYSGLPVHHIVGTGVRERAPA